MRNNCKKPSYRRFVSPSRNYSLFRREKDEVLVNWKYQKVLFPFESVWRESVLFIIGFLFHNKPALIGSKLIFTWSPADLWAESKQRPRNLPLASTDCCGGRRLRDETKECLPRRLDKMWVLLGSSFPKYHLDFDLLDWRPYLERTQLKMCIFKFIHEVARGHWLHCDGNDNLKQ